MIGDAISGFFNKLMFGIIKILSVIVDTFINIMRMLLGLDPLVGGKTNNLLLQALSEESVLWAFVMVLAMSIVTVFIFSIIRIIKTYMSDEKDDGSVSKMKAAKEILRAFVNMIMMPALVICLTLGVTAIANGIDIASGGGQELSYGTEIVFSIVTENDLGSDGLSWKNGSGSNHQIYVIRGSLKDKVLDENDGELPQNISVDMLDKVTGMSAVKYYWSGEDYYNANGQLKNNTCNQSYATFSELVIADNYFANFLLPLLAGCVMVCALGMSVVNVGQRLFYCVFLFIISPFIISTRPLDDGARWRKWLEIFISKLIGSFAIIICLNVFFLLSSYVVSLQFFEASNWLANGITRIIVYIAGVIAATGASQLVASLIGSDAGQQERDQTLGTFRSLGAGAALAGKATRGAGKIAGLGSNFFGGKKSNPLGAGASSSGGIVGGASSMASKIGNVLSGKTSAAQALKGTGKAIGNSRIGQVAKGVGALAGGILLAPTRLGGKVSRGIKDFKAQRKAKQFNSEGQKISKTEQKFQNAQHKAKQKELTLAFKGSKLNRAKNLFFGEDKKPK